MTYAIIYIYEDDNYDIPTRIIPYSYNSNYNVDGDYFYDREHFTNEILSRIYRYMPANYATHYFSSVEEYLAELRANSFLI